MSGAVERRWPGYDRVWRWHFYAGLLCIPFVLWLALTGIVYLFKPQIEGLIDAPMANVASSRGPKAEPSAQVAAAMRAVPGSTLHRYQLPDTPTQAVQVIVGRGGVETRVYVHPETLAVLRSVPERDRIMNIVFRLHGELLAGDAGSYLVELAASWTIVMILSGLFLWWPRGRGIAGTVYPRLRSGTRTFWRDLHAVTGLWVSFAALFLLLSGLPWATGWGAYLKAVRHAVEGAPVKQDWPTGRTDAGTRAMLGTHAEHGGMMMAHQPTSHAALDRIVTGVRPLALAPPVLIAPPTIAGAPWTAKSDAANRPLRTDLTIDAASAQVLTRRDFAQRRLIDRVVGYGIAVHEGALFGWLNQLLNLLTATGLMLLSVSSVVLWWRRRPQAALGAPPLREHGRVAAGFFAIVAMLGVLLPLFGTTLLAVLVMERATVRRGVAARRWLGLRAP